MSPGQTGHITGQMGRVPGTDGTHTRGCPAKILYVYWCFSFPKEGVSGSEIAARNRKSLATFHRTLKSQCNIAFSCLGNRATSGVRDGHRNRKSQKSLRFRCAKLTALCPHVDLPCKQKIGVKKKSVQKLKFKRTAGNFGCDFFGGRGLKPWRNKADKIGGEIH